MMQFNDIKMNMEPLTIIMAALLAALVAWFLTMVLR
jgi:hypothetical protein